MDKLLTIEEVVRKECERYELEKGGFLTNCEEAILALAKLPIAEPKDGCTLEEFRTWKESLLAHLYAQRNYARYFYKIQGSRYLYLLTQKLMRNVTANLWLKHAGRTIDHELHVSRRRTIAFKLSSRLFADIYPDLWNRKVMITAPDQLETRCETSAQELFPIELPLFSERLQCNDREFWNEIVKVIKTLARYVTINQAWVNSNIEEIAEDVSMETALSLQEQLCDNKLEHLASATHLYHWLKVTCRNKLHEYFRFKSKQKEELLTDKEWECLEATAAALEEVEPGSVGKSDHFMYLQDLDVGNSHELSCAIVDILRHKSGEVYRKLTAGQEEKIEVLLLHIYQQMSYEDIARQQYGELTAYELRKVCDKLRQSASRAKKHLRQRMKQIVLELQRDDSTTLKYYDHGRV